MGRCREEHRSTWSLVAMQEDSGTVAEGNDSSISLARNAQALLRFSSAGHHLLALLASLLCLLVLVNGGIQQIQMLLSGGQMLIGNVLPKTALCTVVLLGCLFRPQLDVKELPTTSWLLCIGFLVLEILYLTSASPLSISDVLSSYYDYYAVLLVAPLLLVFRGYVPEHVLIRLTVIVFLVCAAVAFAQYLTNNPVLYTQSIDGNYEVASWDFGGKVRAFSFFESSLEFGAFCALCGALGTALSKTAPIRGILLLLVSALACYCTLTRLCYIVYFASCVSTLILTFGKKPSRGLWHPLFFFILGVGTIVVGLNNFTADDSSKLQDAGSLIERVAQWVFYINLLVQTSFAKLMLGSGITQSAKILPRAPMTIDNSPLALVLHIGFIGGALFSVLMFKMWLWLRREALATQRPFVLAVAGFWATCACAGIFNIVFSLYGTAFGLAMLCNQAVHRDRPVLRESSLLGL